MILFLRHLLPLNSLQLTEEDKGHDVDRAAAMQDRSKGVLVVARAHNRFVVDLQLSEEHAHELVLPIILTKGSKVRIPHMWLADTLQITVLLLQPLRIGGFVLCEMPPCHPMDLAGKLAAHLKKVASVLAAATPSNTPARSIPFVSPIMAKKKDDDSVSIVLTPVCAFYFFFFSSFSLRHVHSYSNPVTCSH